MPDRSIIEIPAVPVSRAEGNNERPIKVAVYCRVSTSSEEQLSSYNSQIEYYTTLIMENSNWQFTGVFADEGITGTSTKNREQFKKMIRKCEQGKINLILTKSVSRFARNTLDCVKYVRKLKEFGVGVVFEKEGINTLEDDDETLFTISGALAQAESVSHSKNVRMGFHQSFKAGKIPFHNIFGYRRGEDDNLVIIMQEEAEVVRRIFEYYLGGQSIRQIRKNLEADGILSPRGKAAWSEGMLQHMLRNEKYSGDVMLQKTYVKDVLTGTSRKNTGQLPQYYIQNNHPAIISRDIFNKVQVEIARRTSKQKTPSTTARTQTSKYSGKFALNEILVCR